MSTGPLSHPEGEQQAPRQHYVGEILSTQPGVRRVSRTVAFRGYAVTFVKGLKENGDIEAGEFFKPARQYDRAAPNKYVPHQGKRECERRRVGGFGFQRRIAAFNARFE